MRTGESVLFVCYGNHCRSPMAEGLAKQRLPRWVRIESAGINPLFEGACPQAVQIMGDDYGVDIAGHRARHILSIHPEDFDHVIVLDEMVYQIIKKYNKIRTENLHLWRIEDPFQQPPEAYKKTAETLLHHIREDLVCNSGQQL